MKLRQTLSVYLISALLAGLAFRYRPFDQTMPPWETWFDSLGLFWSMTLSCSLTLFILVSPSALIAGSFQRYTYNTGLVFVFLLTFGGLLACYFIEPEGPDYSFRIAVSFIVAFVTLLPFSIGNAIRMGFINISNQTAHPTTPRRLFR
jgi:hypothetical protein